MDISLTNTILQIASANSQAQTAQAIQVTVLKKAIDLQASSAAALLDAVPQPPPVNFGPLGTQLDTFA
ncbi:MAG: YjfB family protein [Giesbergeria sp.]